MAQFNKITPCLWFDTRAEEAANFYVGIFKKSRILRTTHYGPDEPRPEGTVLTVDFELDGQEFTALNGGPEFTFDEAVSFQISCANQEEVDEFWTRLTDGGQESQCGWLKDRFGLSWQVVPTELLELVHDPDPGRRNRAVQSMLHMKKIDIAEIRRAAEAG